MNYILALFPMIFLIVLMLGFRWGGQKAGPLAWLVCLVIAILAFGMTWDVWWVSQLKGLILAVYVLLVIWPALFLYNLVDSTGGMRSLVQSLESYFPERGLLLIVLAWCFSGSIEGLSGFGLPLAITAPMLVGLGIEPITAVAAVAIGHAWAEAFGTMGNGFSILSGIVKIDSALLAPPTALLLFVGNIVCGLAVARLLNQWKRWPFVLMLSIIMGVVYFCFAVGGMISLAAFMTGITGIVVAGVWQRFFTKRENPVNEKKDISNALKGALTAYGMLVGMMLLVGLVFPLRDLLSLIMWAPSFPKVATLMGVVTSAGPVLTFWPLVFPGTFIILSSLISYFLFRRWGLSKPGNLASILQTTSRAGFPTTIAVLSVIGLSDMMEHSGMTMLLAGGLSQIMGSVFPLVSIFLGMVGSFATGNLSNSNLLFAPLQKNVALMSGMNPYLLISAQMVGAALGSMVTPAKIIVGCGTVGIIGKDGFVLRRTLPYALAIAVILGLFTMFLVITHY